MRRARALALVVLAAAAGHAQEWTAAERKEIAKREKAVAPATALDQKWSKAAGKTYDVFTQGVDATFTAELSLFMDAFYDQIQQLLPGKNLVARRPEVYVFASKKAFQDRIGGGGRGFYRYAFDGAGRFTEHALYTFIEKDEERAFARFYHPILLHEGTHQVLRERFGKTELPKAFDEGLATYFQLWRLGRTVAENLAGRADGVIDRRDFDRVWATGTRKTIRALLALGPAEWDPDGFGPIAKAHYATAEGLFVFLMSEPAGRKVVKAWWDEIAEGRPPLGRTKDAELAKLEKQLDAFVDARITKRK